MTFGAQETVGTWLDFVQKVGELPDGKWVFRGGLSTWQPETALERACRRWRVRSKDVPRAERILIRDFQRHPEVRNLGLDQDDLLGWLAVMQHHGAPTRLLDWTYSPFVAAHFAFDALFRHDPDAASKTPACAAVWALNTSWLRESLRAMLQKDEWTLNERTKDPKAFRRLYVDRKPPLKFVSTATPMQLNERLSVQQGLFLCPADVSSSWVKNVERMGRLDEASHCRAFIMRDDLMDDAFLGLKRMNVTARSLLPGLDGYSKSMGHWLKLLLRLPGTGD